MAELNYRANEEGAALELRAGGEQLRGTLSIDRYRVNGSAETGGAARWKLDTGTFYGAAGGVVKAGVNYRENLAAPGTVTAMPTYLDKISARQAKDLLNKVEQATHGSYNTRDLPVGAAFYMGGHYPAILSPQRQLQLRMLNSAVDHAVVDIEKARVDLLARLSDTDISNSLKNDTNFQKLKVELSRPFSRYALDAVIIGHIGDLAGTLSSYMQSRGGAQGVSNAAESAVQHAAGKLRAALAGSQVVLPGISQGGDVARNLMTYALSYVSAGADDVVRWINSAPNPQQLRKYHAELRDVVRYDPAVEVSGYVAGAYARSVPYVGQVVLGGMVEKGLRVDVDSVWAVRGKNSRLYKEIIPSSIESRVAFIGVGTRAAAAMPEDVARRLGISLSDSGVSYGQYVAARHQRQTQMGETLKDSATLEAMYKFSQGLGKGNYQYIETGLIHPIQSKDGTKSSAVLRAGRTF